MLQVVLSNNEIYVGERFGMTCQRTLRIPDDGKAYPLPPGLGKIPIHAVEDFASRVPATWRHPHAFFVPMFQREALWLQFHGATWKPNAVKVAVGGVNAISGEKWDDTLRASPQDYIVIPDQPWLDGINVGTGIVRQFIAVPLGSGRSVESQLTGVDEMGGLQVVVFEPKPGKFPDEAPPPAPIAMMPAMSLSTVMGLGAGGQMRQKIYPDRHGVESWDTTNVATVFIYIINSMVYRELTGMEPPPTSISAQTYTEFGLPWFDVYDEARGDVEASRKLQTVRSVRDLDEEQDGRAPGEDASVEVPESDIQKLHLPTDGEPHDRTGG
jgi:hypothetical protein